MTPEDIVPKEICKSDNPLSLQEHFDMHCHDLAGSTWHMHVMPAQKFRTVTAGTHYMNKAIEIPCA